MLGRLSKILVVDGCRDSRQYSDQLLRRLGYEMIEHAPDSGRALKLIGQTNYSLVLTNWDASPSDSLDLLKQARIGQTTACLPFIMAIERWQRKFIEIVREDGATLYMTKPFTAEILKERMTQVDKDARLLKETRARSRSEATERGSTIPALWKAIRPGT